MPNFAMSDDHRNSFVSAVQSLTQVRVNLMERDFPLNEDDVENGLMPQSMRNLYIQLKKLGAENLKDTSNPVFFLFGDGFTRPMAISTNLNRHVWYTYEVQDSRWNAGEAIRTKKSDEHDRKLAFNLSVLTPEKLQKLQKWANDALREHRQQELAKIAVTKFLAHSGSSVAQIITRWPSMKLVFDEMDRNGWSRRGSSNTWRDRVNQVPKARNRWDWTTLQSSAWNWQEKHQRIMQVVDEMLVGSAMLPREDRKSYSAGNRPIMAQVANWRRNEGEVI